MYDEYPKIQTIYKRDMANKGALLEGQWSLPEFEYLAKNPWIFTEKVDGTNIRVMVDIDKILFGGRTSAAQIPDNLLARLQEIFFEEKRLLHEMFPTGNTILYGEGYGGGIQKGGGKYRPDPGFVLFDVKVGSWWLQREAVRDVAVKLGLDWVPVMGEGTLYEAAERARNGFESRWGDFMAEGLVMRPTCELFARNGTRIIAKIKYKDFHRSA